MLWWRRHCGPAAHDPIHIAVAIPKAHLRAGANGACRVAIASSAPFILARGLGMATCSTDRASLLLWALSCEGGQIGDVREVAMQAKIGMCLQASASFAGGPAQRRP